MNDQTQRTDKPTFGFNRPTVLFIVWLGISGAITGLALIDLVHEGFEEAWLFLLSGLLVLWFILRDWFVHNGGEFVSRADDLTFLGLTGFVLIVTLWVLIVQFVL